MPAAPRFLNISLKLPLPSTIKQEINDNGQEVHQQALKRKFFQEMSVSSDFQAACWPEGVKPVVSRVGGAKMRSSNNYVMYERQQDDNEKRKTSYTLCVF